MLVQFGNNGIQKFKYFLWQPNWTRPTAWSSFRCPRKFFHPIISKGDNVVLQYAQILYGMDEGDLNNNWRKDSPYYQIREGILQITKYKKGETN